MSNALCGKPSALLPNPTEEEAKFLTLVKSGDVEKVAQFLFLAIPNGFALTCQNYRGHNALHIAIANKDQKMVTYMLRIESSGFDMGNALLYAVQAGDIRIVQLVLERQHKDESAGKVWHRECKSCRGPQEGECADFTPFVTPLILAAQKNSFEIVKLLLKKWSYDTEAAPGQLQMSPVSVSIDRACLGCFKFIIWCLMLLLSV